MRNGSLCELLTYVNSWRRKKQLQKYLLKHRKKNAKVSVCWNESITVLKVDNYMPRTTDLKGSKTEDSCDPWLEKLIKTSQIKIGQTLLYEHFNSTNSAFFKAWSPKRLQRGRRDNATWSYLKLGVRRNHDENSLQSWRKISSNSKFPFKKGWKQSDDRDNIQPRES